MFSLLLAVIYLSFVSLGLPDSLLGSVWPTIYQEFNVPVSYAGAIFMIISAGTILLFRRRPPQSNCPPDNVPRPDSWPQVRIPIS